MQSAKVASRLLEDKALDQVIEERYESYTKGIGLEIKEGRTDLKSSPLTLLKTTILKISQAAKNG